MTSPLRRESPVDRAGPSLVRSFAVCAVATVWLLGFCGAFFAQSLPNSGLARRDVLASLPEAIAAHFKWTADSHPRFLTQRFDIALTALGIVCGAWGFGRLALRLLGVRLSRFSSAGLALAGGLGLSIWSLLTLGLGLAGLLVQPLFCLLLAAGFFGAILVDHRPESADTPSPPPAPASRHRGLPLLILLLVGPFVTLMLLGAMLPPTDFDVLEYHLQGPKEFYQGGRVRMLPHNVYTSFPFLTEMLALSGMVVRGDWYRGALVGQTVLMSFAVFTACGAHALANSLVRRAGLTAEPHAPEARSGLVDLAGWMAILILLSTPWIYRISVIAYAEGGLACYVTLAALVYVLGRDGEGAERKTTDLAPPARWELLLGLLAGSAAATKYPAVVTVVIPLGFAVLCACRRAGTHWRSAAAAGLWYAIGVLVTFGPWLLKNLVETGNPVYPLLWSIFGGSSFDEATNIRWKAAHSPPLWLLERPGEILPDLWGRLWDVAILSDWQSPLVCGLAPLALLSRPLRRATRDVWFYALWLFTTWCWLTHRIDRFWVPMIPLLAVLGGVGLGSLWLQLRDWRLQSDTPGPVVISGVWGVTLFAVVVFNLGFVTTGLCGFNGYFLDEVAARRSSTAASLKAFAPPPSSKVLFVGEAAVFHADYPLAYNTVFDDSLFVAWTARPDSGGTSRGDELDRPERTIEHLHRNGITHVVVNWREVLRYRAPGSYGFPDFVHPKTFQRLVESQVLRRLGGDLVPFASLSRQDQQTLRSWAPELVGSTRFGEGFLGIEVFQVSGADVPDSAAFHE